MPPELLSVPEIPRLGVVYVPPSVAAGAKGVLYIAREREVAAYLADDSGNPTPLFSLQVGQRATLDRVGATLRVFLPGRTLQLYDASDPSHPIYLGSTVLPLPTRSPGYRFGITLSARVGFSILTYPTGQDINSYAGLLQNSFGVAGGYAVNRARNVQIVLSLQTDFLHSQYTSLYKVLVPIGVQYDFAISRVPGLYLTSRMQIGYGQQITMRTATHPVAGASNEQYVSGTYHSVLLLPEIGIKYAFQRGAERFYLGCDFFSLPILFATEPDAFVYDGGGSVSYRFLLSLGVNL